MIGTGFFLVPVSHPGCSVACKELKSKGRGSKVLFCHLWPRSGTWEHHQTQMHPGSLCTPPGNCILQRHRASHLFCLVSSQLFNSWALILWGHFSLQFGVTYRVNKYPFSVSLQVVLKCSERDRAQGQGTFLLPSRAHEWCKTSHRLTGSAWSFSLLCVWSCRKSFQTIWTGEEILNSLSSWGLLGGLVRLAISCSWSGGEARAQTQGRELASLGWLSC